MHLNSALLDNGVIVNGSYSIYGDCRFIYDPYH